MKVSKEIKEELKKTPCPNCGGVRIQSRGFEKRTGKYTLGCKDCGRRFSVAYNEGVLSRSYEKAEETSTEIKTEFKQDGNEASVFIQTNIIQDFDTLLNVAKVNKDEWIFNKPLIKTWSVPFRNEDKEMTHVQMYSVSGKLEKRKPDSPEFPVVTPVRFEVKERRSERPVVKSDIKRTIVFGDIQAGFLRDIRTGVLNPFHDRKAIDNLLQVLEQEQPDEIITLGDNLDMTEAGKYEKKPEFYFTMQPAINEIGWLMAKIREICPDSKIVYHNSNHGARLQKSLIENLMYAYKLKEFNSDRDLFSLPHMIGLDKLDIEFIDEYPGGEYWINDNLRTLHGNFINLKKELDISKTSFIMGHIHKILKETRTIFDRYGRNAIMGTSIGCLCKIDGTVPAYTKNVNWQQGFCYVESDNKHFNLHHIYINEGKSIFKGQVFQGVDYEEEIKELLYER